MSVEVEARFRASGHDALDDVAAAETLGPARLGPARPAAEEDRYLDTADGRLAAAGWACRLRSRDGLTRLSLKGPPEAGTSGWLHRRPEIEGPATPTPDPATWPASEARDRLLELSGGAPLVERLRLRQARTERSVAIRERAVGTLSIDAVIAEHDGARLGELFVVELELDAERDAEADLPLLAEALGSIRGLRPEPLTKLELALSLMAKSDR